MGLAIRRGGRLATAALALLLALLPPPAIAAGAAAADAFPATLTDLAGREVRLERPPRRILLGEGLQLIAMALVHPDPASVLAGWSDDLERFDPKTYEVFAARFPRLAAVPVVSNRGAGLAAEAALGVRPDLVLLSLWQRPGSDALVRQFEALGVPVAFVDFYVDPIRDTPASMRLLGRILGNAAKGDGFAEFYENRLRGVEAAVAAAPERPTVFLNAYPGAWACCWSAGTANFGEFLAIAGGRNIAASRFPTSDGGMLSLEYVLASRPDVYIGTGLSASENGAGLRLGTGTDGATAAASLDATLADAGLAGLAAARAGRAYGLWNYFNGTPLNIVAVEAMTRWLHPGAPASVDPAATFAEINRRFLAAPLEGTFWTGGSGKR